MKRIYTVLIGLFLVSCATNNNIVITDYSDSMCCSVNIVPDKNMVYYETFEGYQITVYYNNQESLDLSVNEFHEFCYKYH